MVDCDPPLDTVVTNSGVLITSGRFPQQYENNKYCEITITYLEGQRVAIDFLEFDLGRSCYDWLEVRDGNKTTSPIIRQRFCGGDIPDPIVSSGNSVTLVFNTWFSYRHSGFVLRADKG